MTEQQFEKALTANDTGESGGHQAGIHIPKSQKDLLEFLPPLDASVKNPSTWLSCVDEADQEWQFRYIHYNNRLHDEGGTRDEYRVTHMTSFFRAVGARSGDILVIAGEPRTGRLRIRVRSPTVDGAVAGAPARIRLKGWRRVH
jgi:hypothetical protein